MLTIFIQDVMRNFFQISFCKETDCQDTLFVVL